MNHLDVLGTFADYKYTLYTETTARLLSEFGRVHEIIKLQGHVVGNRWDLTGGILLETPDSIIASIFYNADEYNSAMLIHFAYVDPEFRKRGIYKTMHSYIDSIGTYLGKSSVYSYIHLSNTSMINHISEKIGYTPIMQLVKRPINEF